jgi:hypothetical protein
LLSIYKDSELVKDFMDEVLQGKLALGQKELKDSELMSYFNSKSREHGEMLNWSESTIKKIRQIIKNMLS